MLTLPAVTSVVPSWMIRNIMTPYGAWRLVFVTVIDYYCDHRKTSHNNPTYTVGVNRRSEKYPIYRIVHNSYVIVSLPIYYYTLAVFGSLSALSVSFIYLH